MMCVSGASLEKVFVFRFREFPEVFFNIIHELLRPLFILITVQAFPVTVLQYAFQLALAVMIFPVTVHFPV